MTTTTPAPRRTLRARTWAFAVTATAAGLILSGCTADPAPTASTPATTTTATAAAVTPEPTPTLDADQIALELQDKNVTDAKAAQANFSAVFDQIGKDGMTNWERIMPLIGGDLIAAYPTYFQNSAKAGLRATGDTAVVSQSVVDYTPDPTGAGHEQVILDVCLDTSDVDLLNPDGTSSLQAGTPKRLITTVRMQHQDDGRWTYDSEATDEARPC